MKKIPTSLISYDWLFLRYPGIKQRYDWYNANVHKYPVLSKINLFQKYIYCSTVTNTKENWFFVGADLDKEEHILDWFIISDRDYDNCFIRQLFLDWEDRNIEDFGDAWHTCLYQSTPVEYLIESDIKNVRI